METTTNIIDMPWLRVKYLNGEEKLIGIRKAFEDAENIKELLPPVFRGERCYLYRMVTMKLLTTIVMSAYYKKETGFASKTLEYTEDLRNNGIYSDVIKDYLDKWYDRFDLYSETHPFLQNIDIKELTIEDGKYRAWNPYAPGENNKVFGKMRNVDTGKKSILEQYEMNKEEFTYFLIYMAIMGATPCQAVYNENSLAKKVNIVIEIGGDNLAEIILNNVISLENSSAPDEYEDDVFADKPVWELDRVADVNTIDPTILANNILLCTFFPGISMLCTKTDENKNPICVVRKSASNDKKKDKEKDDKKEVKKKKKENVILTTEQVTDYEITKKLAELYKDYSSIVTKDGYKKFVLSNSKAFTLCLLATEHLNGKSSCRILEERDYKSVKGINIYCRETNDYCAPSGFAGVFKDFNKNTFMILNDPDKHKMAEKYQDFYNTAQGIVAYALNTIIDYKKGPLMKSNSFLENLSRKDLSDFMETDFFGKFTEDLISGEDAYENGSDRLIEEALRVFDKHSRHAKDIFKIASARNNMLYQLKVEKNKKSKNKKTKKEKETENE